MLTFTKNKYIQRNAQAGFTFIELVIAMAILAVLAVVVVPNLTRYLGQAKQTRTEETLNTLKLTINSFYADTGKYPNRLEDLIKKPADVKRWRGPYLEKTELPEDGWNNPFIYRLNPKGAAHPFELYSENPEGEKYSVWEIGTK